MEHLICKVLALSLMTVTGYAEDLQRWNIQTKMGVQLTLKCEDVFNLTKVSDTDNIIWTKKDHGEIHSDDTYTLTTNDGIANMSLHFNVADHTNGIYFCEVSSAAGQFRGMVVKGVNIGGHDYDDFLEKYERNLIVGVIAGGSVLFLVIALGLLNHFQYRSEEQKTKYRTRKEEHLRRYQHKMPANGYDNTGMNMDDLGRKGEYVINYPYEEQDNTMKTSF